MYGYQHYVLAVQDIVPVGFSSVFNWSTKPSLSSYTSDTSRTCIKSSLSLLSSSRPQNRILHASRTSLISVQPMNQPGCYSGGKLRHNMIWDASPEKGSSGIHTPVQALQAPADKVTPYSERPTVFPAWAGILSPEGHKAGDWGHPRTMIPSAALNFTQSRASSVCA